MAVVVLLLMGVQARAQPAHHVAWSKVELAYWVLHPVYAEDQGVFEQVVGFLAIADPGAVVEGNLVAVWYRREAPGTWSARSWTTGDPWEAVESVKQEMGIPDEQDERWGLPYLEDEFEDPEPPQDYADGLLAADPLAPVLAGQPERPALVEMLVSVGHPAAAISLDDESDCTRDTKLEALAAGIAQTLQGEEGSMSERVMNALLAHGAANCAALSGITIAPWAPTITPLQPWGPPFYECVEYWGWTQNCRKETWTEWRVHTHTRMVFCLDSISPPVIRVIQQTRTCWSMRRTTCIVCVPRPGPAPTCPPPGTPSPPRPVPPALLCTTFTFNTPGGNYHNCGPWTPLCNP